ncbi:antibiotic biosynthesis monooxygenase [Microbacterium sp. LWO13-1.2]|uniref:group II truncated hemoglobin n=1 Tax=Microbacterium sp. LWO13-1.2 TaxID=3135262 RepID=UPI00313A1FB1
MIVEYVRYRIQAEKADEFRAAYRQAAEALRESPHCLNYELAANTEEPELFTLRIEWDSPQGHLSGFRQSSQFQKFFSFVKPFVSAIEEMRHYEVADVVGDGGGKPAPPTLYEWAGGPEAFERLFSRFYEKVAGDDVLAPMFASMDSRHAHHVSLWLGEVFGGPALYTEQRGGYPNMLAHHVGKAITPEQRRRWAMLLFDTADEVGLPDDPEFRAAFAGYIEWGTRIALANSQPDATPPRRAPVPRWGWGVAPPWQQSRPSTEAAHS